MRELDISTIIEVNFEQFKNTVFSALSDPIRHQILYLLNIQLFCVCVWSEKWSILLTQNYRIISKLLKPPDWLKKNKTAFFSYIPSHRRENGVFRSGCTFDLHFFNSGFVDHTVGEFWNISNQGNRLKKSYSDATFYQFEITWNRLKLLEIWRTIHWRAQATCASICPISRFSALWMCSSSVVLCIPICSASLFAFTLRGWSKYPRR